jgi:hypothetical protein
MSPQTPPARKRITLLASCLAAFIISLDVTIVNVALRFVSRSMVRCRLRLVLRRLAWVIAAGEGWCRIIAAVLIARRSYAARNSWIRLLMSEGAGPSRSSPGGSISPGLRSGPAVVWHPVHPAPGSCRDGRPGTLIGGSRRSVSGQRRSRGCISAVCWPLCQVYALTGA